MNGQETGRVKNLIFMNHQLSKEFVSGGERMFLEVLKRFPKLGIDSCPVVPETAAETMNAEGAGKIITLPVFGFEKKPYSDTPFDMLRIWFVFVCRSLYGAVKVRRWIETSGAQCIYSTGDFMPDTVPAATAKLTGKAKWVCLIHHLIESPSERKTGGYLPNAGSYLMQRFSFFLIKRFADGVFIKNNLVKKELLRTGFAPEKIFVIDNGIDLEKIEEMPSDHPEPFDACYVGRLSASKGITDLIRIWEKITEKMPEARLAIVGGGSRLLEAEKREEVARLGLGKNISILGSLPDTEAYRIRKTAKLSLSCSYEEGWGITIAESLACGTPCVVYDLPVYEEKFKGAVATVKTGDMDAFALTTERLLADGDERARMGRRGREIVKSYDIEAIARREAECIRQICGGAR